jgi:hypothetical protein
MIRRQIIGYIWTFEFISFYTVRGTLRRMTPVMVYSPFHVYIQVYWFLHLFYLIFSLTLCLNMSHISRLCCTGTVYNIHILYYLFISSPFQQKTAFSTFFFWTTLLYRGLCSTHKKFDSENGERMSSDQDIRQRIILKWMLSNMWGCGVHSPGQ